MLSDLLEQLNQIRPLLIYPGSWQAIFFQELNPEIKEVVELKSGYLLRTSVRKL